MTERKAEWEDVGLTLICSRRCFGPVIRAKSRLMISLYICYD